MLLGGWYPGGHLSFVLDVEVNRTAWEQRPQQWTPVLADTELADGELCSSAARQRLGRKAGRVAVARSHGVVVVSVGGPAGASGLGMGVMARVINAELAGAVAPRAPA